MNVDLSQLAFPGTAAQQQTAINHYLSQFDAANTRGHGNDHSVLTGLADFTASLSGRFSNFTTRESGQIAYQVSQSTQSEGTDKGQLSVVQTATTTLTSSYAKNRVGADPKKGNWDIFRVSDSSSTTTAFDYFKDQLKAASTTYVVKQPDQYEKLVNFKVADRKDTPAERITLQDISAR